jgi:hypothetical protein
MYRRAEERKAQERHKRVIRYLKNMENKKDNIETAYIAVSSPPGGRGRLPEINPSSCCDRLAKVALGQYLHYCKFSVGISSENYSLLSGRPAVKQDKPPFPIPKELWQCTILRRPVD